MGKRDFIKKSLGIIEACYWFVFRGGWHSEQTYKDGKGKIAILANGPSLKAVLPSVVDGGEFKDVEFSVHNFFAFTPEFFLIKPKYYALADPMYIKKNHRYYEVSRLFNIFQNDVDWDMTLYIVFEKKNFLRFSKLTNPHLKIVRINSFGVDSFDWLCHWMYNNGYDSPGIGSVVQLNIFAAINDGFKEINLYGVDHTHICNLSINDKNQLCSIEEHFYDDSARYLKPILRYDGQVYPISEFLSFNGFLFKSHELLNKYALYHQARIVNYTPNSMIDSYERNNKNNKKDSATS